MEYDVKVKVQSVLLFSRRLSSWRLGGGTFLWWLHSWCLLGFGLAKRYSFFGAWQRRGPAGAV